MSVLVKFLTPQQLPMGVFAGGEIAGFALDVANGLIAKGVAELYDAGAGPGVPNPVGYSSD